MDPISILSDETHILTVLKHELLLNDRELAVFQKELLRGEDFLNLTQSDLREEFPTITYSTRKRIMNYIEMVRQLPDIEHESILRNETLDDHLDQGTLQSFEEQQIDLMDRVHETLNEIGMLLQIKECGHLMPPELKVTRLQLERCVNMYARGELGGEERYNRLPWSDELPIHYFTDVLVLSGTDRNLHFRVLRSLQKREFNAAHYLREDAAAKKEMRVSAMRPVPPPLDGGVYTPQSPTQTIRRFKVNGVEHVEDSVKEDEHSTTELPSAILPHPDVEESTSPLALHTSSLVLSPKVMSSPPHVKTISPRSPLSTPTTPPDPYFDEPLVQQDFSPRRAPVHSPASPKTRIVLPPRSKFEEERLVRLLTGGGSSPRKRLSLSMDHSPLRNSAEGLASSVIQSPRYMPSPPSKRRNSQQTMSPRRVHTIPGISPVRRHQSALLRSAERRNADQDAHRMPRRNSMFPPIKKPDRNLNESLDKLNSMIHAVLDE